MPGAHVTPVRHALRTESTILFLTHLELRPAVECGSCVHGIQGAGLEGQASRVTPDELGRVDALEAEASVGLEQHGLGVVGGDDTLEHARLDLSPHQRPLRLSRVSRTAHRRQRPRSRTSLRVMSPDPQERSTTVPVAVPFLRKSSSSAASLSMPGKPARSKFCLQPRSSAPTDTVHSRRSSQNASFYIFKQPAPPALT